jgi:acetyl-CoA acyltransferase 1
MTIHSPDVGPPPASQEILANSQARDAQLPMGWTSENVAGDFSISRQDMDSFSAMSYQRAEKAQKTGRFDDEIVPFGAYSKDADSNTRKRIILTKDDGIRPGTTAEALGKIRAAFPQWAPSHTTGGNASQITDGVAAVMLMTRREAERLGCDILGRHITTAVAGLAPRIMGIGPSIAIPKALEKAGITQDQVDLFEVRNHLLSSTRHS